ncbi:uncharacterized protein LOC119929962 isoform X2 [Tachyglossus aculeatus]|uniref:uncharacterized protein LOC119929962 isoform X2 n=1 Tax=Tachyglossus aculeatus TaxID=9261 RepID=UPI0018F6360C|nr:uncharacterized protein LOC119929962 isoform X2 [Tachyglossus aculeatus]
MAAKLMLEILTGNSSGISWNPPGAENSSSASENTEVANVKGITDASEDTEVANVKEVMGRMAHTGYEAFQEPAISPDPRTLLSKQSEDSESGEEVGSSDVPEDSSIRSPSDSSASMGYFPCYRTYEEFLEKPSPSLTRTSSAQSNRRDGSGCSSSLEPLEQRSQSSGHTMESHPRSWESMDTLTQSNLNTPKRYQSHLGLLLATRGEGGLGEKPEPQIFEILSPPAFQQNMGGMLEPIPRKSPQLKPLSSPRGTQEKRRRRKKVSRNQWHLGLSSRTAAKKTSPTRCKGNGRVSPLSSSQTRNLLQMTPQRLLPHPASAASCAGFATPSQGRGR